MFSLVSKIQLSCYLINVIKVSGYDYLNMCVYTYMHNVACVNTLATKIVLLTFALSYFCRNDGGFSLNYPHSPLCSQVLQSPARPFSDPVCDPAMGSLTEV